MLVDPRLEGNYNPSEMARMVASAAACIRHSAKKRPRMSQIVRALEGDVLNEDLGEGGRPAPNMLFSSSSEYDSSTYTTPKTNRAKRVVVASSENSGECSGPIREHDSHQSASSMDSLPSLKTKEV